MHAKEPHTSLFVHFTSRFQRSTLNRHFVENSFGPAVRGLRPAFFNGWVRVTYSPASYLEDTGWVAGKYVWDLWWKIGSAPLPPPECSSFPFSSPTHQRSILIHSSPTLYNLSKMTRLQISSHISSLSKFNNNFFSLKIQ